MRIGILGGGIAGLACAHYLLKAGHEPVVLEAESETGGGLTSRFEHRGMEFDRFHRALLPVDSALLGLMADIDVLDRLVWHDVSNAIVTEGRVHSFDDARDVWRIPGLGLAERLRVAAATTYLTRMPGYGRGLDQKPAAEWLRFWMGSDSYERIWAPMLEARFGAWADEAPAFWVWTLLQRYRHRAGGKRGSLRGGYHGLARTLTDSIRHRGGEVIGDAPALRVEWDFGRAVVELEGASAVFDGLISTIPLSEFAKIASAPLLRDIPSPEPEHLGNVTAAVVTRRPLPRFYSTLIFDDDFGFYSIENPSRLAAPGLGRPHVVYLRRACQAEATAYREPDADVRKTALETLERLFPDFEAGDVEHVEISRAPHVEPVWSVGSLDRKPPQRLANTRILLCTTSHAYPRMPGWDTSVTLAREVVEKSVA